MLCIEIKSTIQSTNKIKIFYNFVNRLLREFWYRFFFQPAPIIFQNIDKWKENRHCRKSQEKSQITTDRNEKVTCIIDKRLNVLLNIKCVKAQNEEIKIVQKFWAMWLFFWCNPSIFVSVSLFDTVTNLKKYQIFYVKRKLKN